MKLIEDFNQFHKFLSVQVTVIGSAVVATVIADPATASAAIGGFISAKYLPMVTVAVNAFVILYARARAQPKLKGGSNGTSAS